MVLIREINDEDAIGKDIGLPAKLCRTDYYESALITLADIIRDSTKEEVMGMYDTLKMRCPNCGLMTSYQSKFGQCEMQEFSLQDAPLMVIADANGEGEQNKLYCESCNKPFEIEVRFVATPKTRGDNPDADQFRTV